VSALKTAVGTERAEPLEVKSRFILTAHEHRALGLSKLPRPERALAIAAALVEVESKAKAAGAKDALEQIVEFVENHKYPSVGNVIYVPKLLSAIRALIEPVEQPLGNYQAICPNCGRVASITGCDFCVLDEGPPGLVKP
jgi:hypothetical protein